MGRKNKRNNNDTKKSQKQRFDILEEIIVLKEELAEIGDDYTIENLNYIEKLLRSQPIINR